MSANLRCYNPNTAKITFSLDNHTTRFLGILGVGMTSGSINMRTGTGETPFYVIAGSSAWNFVRTHQFENRQLASDESGAIQITFAQNTLFYQKPSDCIIYYGVFQ